MKILFYGGRGWIGSQFIEHLSGVEVVLGNARVDNVEALKEEISEVSPSHIVSFIGRTSGTTSDGTLINTIDFLEQPGNLVLNVRDNLFSAIVLAQICSKRGIHFTYLGTGCVFNYDDRHSQPFPGSDGFEETGFEEHDKPNFFGSSYSVVKGFTDRLMHEFDEDVLNLRIRMPISKEDNRKDFITKIKTYEKVCNIPNSMTVLSDFFPIWQDLMEKRITGTWNCTNPGTIEHNDILRMHQEIVDPDFTWQNFTIEEQDAILDSKRSNNKLDTTKLQAFYPEIPNIKDSVRRIIRNRK